MRRAWDETPRLTGVVLEVSAETARAYERAGQFVEVELGHDASKLALGNAFVMGFGVEKDPQRGLALITEAAENGFAEAQIELGRMHIKGRAVERNEERAYKWFCKAGPAGQAHFMMEYGKPLSCNEL